MAVVSTSSPPPGGWLWHHPSSGATYTADAFEDFRGRIERTLLNLGMDPSEAGAQIHAATAEALVAKGHRDLVRPVKEVKRTAGQYVSGLKATALKWWMESPVYGLIKGKSDRGEGVFVDQAEGDRRAAICANCPRNVIPAGKGWLQNWTDGQMLDAVEGRTTASHGSLGVCEVCSCELRASVWWQPDIVSATTRDAKFAKDLPGHCWKRRIISDPTAG